MIRRRPSLSHLLRFIATPPARIAAGLALAAVLLPPAPHAQALTNPANRHDRGQPYLYPFQIHENQLAGPPAQAALNTPLDASAAPHVRAGHFHTVGADGIAGTADDQRLRFYGINLSFYSNFPEPDDAAKIAQRLRKLGFNAVRLHHMDSLPSDATDPPRSILTTGPYPTFNEEAVKRLRHFIQALAREGLYTNLNLRVGYRFRPGTDDVPAFDAGALRHALSAPMYIYEDRMIALQETYARQIIQTLGLAHNPALAMVEISNESSLLSAWHTPPEWNDAVPLSYAPKLEALWNRWLQDKYGSLDKACDAWGTCSAQERKRPPLLNPAESEVEHSALAEMTQKLKRRVNNLSARLASPEDPFERQPPTGRELRTQDFLLFLADTDKRYFDRMARTVKATAGERVPVTGTQMSYGGILNLASHAGMDYIDEHFYVDHPHFPQGMVNPRDWRIWNLALSQTQMGRLLRVALLRDSAKPFVVSEYNQPFPSWQGAEMLPLMATVAALQDWDGLFFFDYGNLFEEESAPANFGLRGDWGKYAIVGQSARLFRSGGIPPLSRQHFLPVPPALQASIAASNAPDERYRQLMEAGGIVPDSLWRQRIGINPQAGAARPPGDAPSAGGEAVLAHDTAQGVVTLQSPGAWGIFGLISGKHYDSQHLQLRFGADGKHPTSLLLTPLDGPAIDDARRLLLTLGSATVGSEPGSRPARPKAWVPHPAGSSSWTLAPDPAHPQSPSGSRYTTGPAWLLADPVRVSWRTRAAKVRVHPLDGKGQRLPALPPPDAGIEDGTLHLRLHMTPGQSSPWYEILLED